MVRKRRRAKYTWMPTLGGEAQVGEGEPQFTTHFGANVPVQNTAQGPINIYVTPIVPDGTHFGLVNAEVEDTLQDLTSGQDWLLKRIVGKIRCGVGQFVNVGTTPKYITACAAFFVAKSDDFNQALPALTAEDYDPMATNNVRNPWIWRRTWQMMNGLSSSTIADPPILEVNNMAAVSVADGPHIDSKVARRIRREERLWFVFNAYGEDTMSGTPSSAPFVEEGHVQFQLDYRILGALRRSTNKSTF